MKQIENNYYMTAWILAGNYISFTIAAGLIRLHMLGVKKSRVQLGRARVTVLSMAITGTVLLEIPAIVGVKSNITTFNYVCRLIVNMFISVEIDLTNLNTQIWTARGSASRVQRP